MADGEVIETFLARLKAEGRSSPAGSDWHEFWQWLNEHKPAGLDKPPVPLILAAAGASNASKHQRLRDQMRWAANHGLTDGPMKWLEALPRDRWNTGPVESWHDDNWP